MPCRLLPALVVDPIAYLNGADSVFRSATRIGSEALQFEGMSVIVVDENAANAPSVLVASAGMAWTALHASP